MKRDVGRHGRHKRSNRLHVGIGVVSPWHDKRRHLDMAACLVQHRNRTTYGIEIAANPIIVILRRTLEVDVRRVDERRELRHHLFARATVRDKDIEHAACADLLRAVAHELPTDKRLVVSVCKPYVALIVLEPRREIRKLDRRHRPARHFVHSMLRDSVVLTKRTAKVAAV